MDLAIVLAALALWPLVHGGIVLSRWLGTENATELLWYGVAGIAIALGMALFAARYFEGSFILTVGLANIALLTSVTLFVQGIFASDGYPPEPYPFMIPGLAWCAAISLGYFQNSIEARIWLFCLLALFAGCFAIGQLVRGGLLLRGRLLWTMAWCVFVMAMAVKIIDVRGVAIDFQERYDLAFWHVLHMVLIFVSANAIAVFILTRAYAIPSQNTFTTQLADRLVVACGSDAAAARQFPQELQIWSIRLDPIESASPSSKAVIVQAANDVARAIATSCPTPRHVRQTGSDRVVWLSAPSQHGHQRLIRHLTSLSHVAQFPMATMSVGTTSVAGRNLLSAAAEADRRATVISRSRV